MSTRATSSSGSCTWSEKIQKTKQKASGLRTPVPCLTVICKSIGAIRELTTSDVDSCVDGLLTVMLTVQAAPLLGLWTV